jgi:hypothetical protein
MSINLMSANAYIMARQRHESTLKCSEKGNAHGEDPDKSVQELWRSKKYPRVCHTDAFRKDT